MSKLRDLVKKYELTIDNVLAASTQNMANQLRSMLQKLFNVMKKENGCGPLISATHMDVGQIYLSTEAAIKSAIL